MNFSPNHPLHPDVCKCWDCATGKPQSVVPASHIDVVDMSTTPQESNTSRICHYCKTAQHPGLECAHCGAPDPNNPPAKQLPPLEMAPMGVIFA